MWVLCRALMFWRTQTHYNCQAMPRVWNNGLLLCKEFFKKLLVLGFIYHHGKHGSLETTLTMLEAGALLSQGDWKIIVGLCLKTTTAKWTAPTNWICLLSCHVCIFVTHARMKRARTCCRLVGRICRKISSGLSDWSKKTWIEPRLCWKTFSSIRKAPHSAIRAILTLPNTWPSFPPVTISFHRRLMSILRALEFSYVDQFMRRKKVCRRFCRRLFWCSKDIWRGLCRFFSTFAATQFLLEFHNRTHIFWIKLFWMKP